MIKYILKRLFLGICALLVLMSITFVMMKAIPGNPFSRENKSITPAQMEQLNEKYGLDKPVFEQYLAYMKSAIKGDLGESIKKTGRKVTDIIKETAPVSASVGCTAFVIAVVVGITFGIVGALSKNGGIRGFTTVLATIGVSVPSFLLAMLLMVLFGVKLQILPLVGLSTAKHYILPSIALALYPISMITRLVRSTLSEVMHQDYITLARSKGTKEMRVIIKHGLKNALLPVVTYCGPMIVGLMTGSFVIETLFSIPGIGSEFVSSVTNRDYTLIMGLTTFLGALMIIANLASDIVAALVDPRIKFEK